jgi:uncharacterized membrane protein YagU involved in acid resistance
MLPVNFIAPNVLVICHVAFSLIFTVIFTVIFTAVFRVTGWCRCPQCTNSIHQLLGHMVPFGCIKHKPMCSLAQAVDCQVLVSCCTAAAAATAANGSKA